MLTRILIDIDEPMVVVLSCQGPPWHALVNSTKPDELRVREECSINSSRCFAALSEA